MNKINVLIINGYYFPAQNYGGPSSSIFNLVNLLGNDINFYIVARDHDYGDNKRFVNIKTGWNDSINSYVKYLSDENYTYKTFIEIINEKKINVIYYSGFFMKKIRNVIYLSRKVNIPLILSPRGELNRGALQIKKNKKQLYLFFVRLINLYKNVLFHSTCLDETIAIKRYLKIKDTNIIEIPNVPQAINYIKRKRNSKLKIISICRISKIKNISGNLQMLSKIDFPFEYDIYGPIEDSTYYNECLNIANELNKKSNVKISFFGSIDHNKIADTLKKYDLMLSLTKSENYGQTIAESLSMCCPIIISRETTPWDEIDKVAGFTISDGDEKSFINALNYFNELTQEETEKLQLRIFDYISKKFAYNELHSKYFTMFNNTGK